MVGGTEAVFEDEAGDAAGVKPLSDVRTLILHGKMLIAAAGGDDDGGACGVLGGEVGGEGGSVGFGSALR